MERLIQALTASMDPASLVGRVSEQVCAFVPNADGAAVTLLRGSDNAYVTVSAHGLVAAATGFVVPADSSFQGLAARERRPKLSHDGMTDERLSARVRAVNKQWDSRSWAVIPLMYHGDPIGSLLLAASAAGAFTDADLDALLAISEFVSALVGAQLQLSALLTQVMTDGDDRGRRALTARFIASVMVPEAAETEGLQERLDALLAQPDALRAVFQPIVRLDNRTTVAYEGLMRFPASSGVTPIQWFSAARRLGRGVDLEYAALRTVLSEASPIPGDCPVSVNLSPSAVLEPAIQDMLAAQDRALVVEITEHEPFPADLVLGLKSLRDRGVSVAVDDAGSGYANFTQLLRLRPEMIKIDGELIAAIDDDPVARAMATALKSLASELKAKTVAEAVETPSQLQTLIGLGIEYGQGFYLGPPSDAVDLIRQL
ncbi:sensor domain-containing phosphodiesterase [Mycolicibacterium pallens]|uniref:EAL domain-containing protein n=1 Tax=Mycolicibacterium pallens TaxID=370524 RepID=A0ABX8VJC4_9MYCO|nr:EAL domain-containing protein [Mycolicibacterium pallens]QYL16081.1 EAL domain-containing protein [Mycolicibacterium pallens]